MKLIHKPQQKRSKNTQEKLLISFESLLKERFFESITIRDIAHRAELSPGTIYRRFKNKEALLPTLYERYDKRLCEWASSIWKGNNLKENSDLKSRITWVVKEHVRFYKKYEHILRTVYIYNRLHGEIPLPESEELRKEIYSILLSPIWDCLENKSNLSGDKVRCFILILITTINERMLFKRSKPSSVLKIDEETFIKELSIALKVYIQN